MLYRGDYLQSHKYREASNYARFKFLKTSHKTKTYFPSKTLYFLGLGDDNLILHSVWLYHQWTYGAEHHIYIFMQYTYIFTQHIYL
jgi:hypothetical protein